VPWTNKNLTVKWERFVNKLEPGAKETFTAVISGPDAKKAVAEMVAAMYDSSLDAYLPHDWMKRFGVFRHDYSNMNLGFDNTSKWFYHIHGHWPYSHKSVDLRYRGFPSELTYNWMRYEYFGRGGGYGWGDSLACPRLPARPRLAPVAAVRRRTRPTQVIRRRHRNPATVNPASAPARTLAQSPLGRT
jgi:hypothetical protein